MQSSVAEFPSGVRAKETSAAASLPWYCFVVVLAAACIPIGAIWDISWHSTIGRDSFWTPAHMMIYAGGAIPGMVCGWIVLQCSFFSTEAERAGAVRYLGFHGPLGAWVCIWGSLTMLVSAPFDNWWHDAYGLDVEILSPPHTLLALGMYAVAVGAMLLVLSWQNRGDNTASRMAGRLYLFSMAVLLVMASIILTEHSYPNAQRGALFYKISCITYGFYLAMALRASRSKWGATWSALGYMGIVCAMIWILPLFKAQPLLAPIYLQVDHMVPPVFPLILIGPALAMDLIAQRFGPANRWKDWALAAVLAAAFVMTFLAIQWNFSGFLLQSPSAKNWFFAAGEQWPYFAKGTEWRHRFWGKDSDAVTASAVAIIVGFTFAASRLGLAIGTWMSKVRR
jgi:hypothetical protein